MKAQTILVDIVALFFAVVAFSMAFRQNFIRRLLGRDPALDDSSGDPLTYILRIAGIMLLAFSIALAGMLTLFHLS